MPGTAESCPRIDGKMLHALCELRGADEGIRLLCFTAGIDVIGRLVGAGLVRIDRPPARLAMIRITLKGELLLLDYDHDARRSSGA